MNLKQLQFKERRYFSTGERKKESSSLLKRRMQGSLKESLTLSTATQVKKISPQEALRNGDYDIDTSDLDLVQNNKDTSDDDVE